MHPTPFLLHLDHRSSFGRQLVDSDAELSQLDLGLLNLRRELLVRVGNVVEGEDAEAESEEEVCAKGHECPEGELLQRVRTSI